MDDRESGLYVDTGKSMYTGKPLPQSFRVVKVANGWIFYAGNNNYNDAKVFNDRGELRREIDLWLEKSLNG